jgi:hypothetical protein
MKDNEMKKTVKKANARKLTSAQASNLASVRRAAFASGTSRNAVVAATRAALGAKPVQTLYAAGKLELQIGFMAAALARKGDNREPDALMAHCRERLTVYAGFGGKAKLRKGLKGRRTKDEEAAYLSARVQTSGIMKDAGVRVPESRGGDTSKTRAKNGTKKGQGKAKVAANNNRPLSPKCKSAAEMVAYALVQAKALQATMNKSAAVCPAALGTAINAFVSAAIEADKAL